MPGGTSVGGFQPSSSGLVQSRNRRSASSRTSPTTPLIRAIPSVQSLISLSQVCLYCSWVVALVCWYDSSSSRRSFSYFSLSAAILGG